MLLQSGCTVFLLMALSIVRSFCFPSRRLLVVVALIGSIAVSQAGQAQSTSAGVAIDLEIVNQIDGTNSFCVAPGDALTARLFIRPGSTSTSCTPACGTPVNGGNAHLATAIVDIAFDNQKLTVLSATNNPETAAADGLIQNNNVQGRIGWALAGDWTPNANTSGTLASPCDMGLLETGGWVAEVVLSASATASGGTMLHIRRQTDSQPFPLSFADICGDEAFIKSNGGVDEIVDGAILISTSCADVLFFDGFESQSADNWSHITGG